MIYRSHLQILEMRTAFAIKADFTGKAAAFDEESDLGFDTPLYYTIGGKIKFSSATWAS